MLGLIGALAGLVLLLLLFIWHKSRQEARTQEQIASDWTIKVCRENLSSLQMFLASTLLYDRLSKAAGRRSYVR